MAVNPIPFPTPPTTLRQAVRDEHFEAVAALFPAAMSVLAERIEVGRDWGAAKLVIDACLPKNRPVALGGDCSTASIEKALATGKLSPAEAKDVAQALSAIRNVDQIEALAERITQLEAALGAAA